MEEKEMEIFTDIMRKCGVNTEKYTWSELEDIAKAMEEYHQTKLKLLGIADVSQQRELMYTVCDKLAEAIHKHPLPPSLKSAIINDVLADNCA